MNGRMEEAFYLKWVTRKIGVEKEGVEGLGASASHSVEMTLTIESRESLRNASHGLLTLTKVKQSKNGRKRTKDGLMKIGTQTRLIKRKNE